MFYVLWAMRVYSLVTFAGCVFATGMVLVSEEFPLSALFGLLAVQHVVLFLNVEDAIEDHHHG